MTKTDDLEEILIRRVKGGEMDQVLKLTINSFSKEIGITGLDVKRLRSSLKFYRLLTYFYGFLDILGLDFDTILVAVTNGTVAGEIHLVPHGKRIWSLDSSAVDARFRGRGIFRNLLKEALHYISERHGETVLTSLWTNNIASVKVTNELKFDVFEEKTLLHLEDIKVGSLESSGEMEIRNAEPKDAKKVHEILRAISPRQNDAFKAATENSSESLMQRLRNGITKVNSKKWIMSLKGEPIGFAKVAYTSRKEAASIESFYLLPSVSQSEHVSILLNEILIFLKRQGISKVTANVNTEWKEVLNSFESFGFTSIASIYEMMKVLPSNSHKRLKHEELEHGFKGKNQH